MNLWFKAKECYVTAIYWNRQSCWQLINILSVEDCYTKSDSQCEGLLVTIICLWWTIKIMQTEHAFREPSVAHMLTHIGVIQQNVGYVKWTKGKLRAFTSPISSKLSACSRKTCHTMESAWGLLMARCLYGARTSAPTVVTYKLKPHVSQCYENALPPEGYT